MIIYNVAVPIFSDEERVEFTVDTENAVITFICEWWDDLWHCSTTIDNGDKRSCVLYPNVLYYPQDRTYSFKIVTTKSIIGFTDLSGLELIVGVSETFGSTVSAGITSETVIDTPIEALFGSAAYRDVGSEAAQIPLNSNLGSAAYKNVESIYLETNDPVAVDNMAIRDIRRYTKLTAYYSTGIAFTATGATFEGRASLSLYGQYSFVEIERISATVFAIRDWKDEGTFNQRLVSYGDGSVNKIFKATTSSNDGGVSYLLVSKLDAPGGIESAKGFMGRVLCTRGSQSFGNISTMYDIVLRKAYSGIQANQMGFLGGLYSFNLGYCVFEGSTYLCIKLSGSLCVITLDGWYFGNLDLRCQHEAFVSSYTNLV